jgi:hypothetical protein
MKRAGKGPASLPDGRDPEFALDEGRQQHGPYPRTVAPEADDLFLRIEQIPTPLAGQMEGDGEAYALGNSTALEHREDVETSKGDDLADESAARHEATSR